MKFAILAIGNEITTGRIQDTNSSYISRELNARGCQVCAIAAAGDDEDSIRKALDYMFGQADTLIITGGLGPTADDITTAAIAGIFGRKLVLDESVLQYIKDRFEKLRIEFTPNNIKQALFPEGSKPIPNLNGTAWGFDLQVKGKRLIVLPGVPSEVAKMISEEVIPLFQRGSAEQVCTQAIKLFGISESKIDQTLENAFTDLPGLSTGFYPRFPENHIVLTCRSASKETAEQNIATAVLRIEQRLKKYIFGYGNPTLEEIVSSLLKGRSLTLAIAESCTGGLISDRLTNVPGSSEFLMADVVAYSNQSKIDLLGVSPATIEKFGAVSEQTALEMAEGARQKGKAQIGLSTTGIAGPTGGTEAKPVGTVYIAISDANTSKWRRFQFRWDRRRVKEMSAQWALEILRRYLTGQEIQ